MQLQIVPSEKYVMQSIYNSLIHKYNPSRGHNTIISRENYLKGKVILPLRNNETNTISL